MIRRLIDMQASSEIAGPSALMAYGTSEGVTKAWDTRGRRGKRNAKLDQRLDEIKTYAIENGLPSTAKQIEGVQHSARSGKDFTEKHIDYLADLADRHDDLASRVGSYTAKDTPKEKVHSEIFTRLHSALTKHYHGERG